MPRLLAPDEPPAVRNPEPQCRQPLGDQLRPRQQSRAPRPGHAGPRRRRPRPPHRLGYRRRRRHARPGRAPRCLGDPAKLFAPGDRLQPAFAHRIIHSRTQRKYRRAGQYEFIGRTEAATPAGRVRALPGRHRGHAGCPAQPRAGIPCCWRCTASPRFTTAFTAPCRPPCSTTATRAWPARYITASARNPDWWWATTNLTTSPTTRITPSRSTPSHAACRMWNSKYARI